MSNTIGTFLGIIIITFKLGKKFQINPVVDLRHARLPGYPPPPRLTKFSKYHCRPFTYIQFIQFISSRMDGFSLRSIISYNDHINESQIG